MSYLLPKTLNSLILIALVVLSAAIVVCVLVLVKILSQKRKKRRAIRLYAKRLGRLLRTSYGVQDKYTPTQVKQKIKSLGMRLGMSNDYDCYGLAMYCDYSDFMDYHHSTGESCNYEAMRGEISHCLFDTHTTTFTLPDVLESASQFHPSEHYSHNHEDGGGHHDGGYDGWYDGGYDGGYDSGGDY